MSNEITPSEFVRLFMSAYIELGRDAFVTHILRVTPREGDVWQDEKFKLFQNTGSALARLSPEYITNIINYGTLYRS